MKRYRIDVTGQSEHEHGEWVRYDDIEQPPSIVPRAVPPPPAAHSVEAHEDVRYLAQCLVDQENVLEACEALLKEALADDGVDCGYEHRLATYWDKSKALGDWRSRELRLSQPPPVDDACICKGNWRSIVKEVEHLIGKEFRNSAGNTYRFFGVVHGDDDYYYGMADKDGCRLLSCVGSLEGHGYKLTSSGPTKGEG